MFIAEVAEPGMLDNPLVCAGIGVVVGLVVGFVAGKMASKGGGSKKSPSAAKKRSRPSPAGPSRSGGGGGGNGLIEIYVGNMSYETDEKLMRKMFEKFGTVASSRIIDNRRNGKSKGYGFIEMPKRSEAEAAINDLNNKEVMGRKLRVNEARNKQRDD